MQAGERFALIQPPDQPGGDAQILGMGAEQGLAVFADFLPVDTAGFMQGGGFTQLVFQYFVFAGITHVCAGEVPFVNGEFGQLQIMSGELVRIGHSMTRLMIQVTRDVMAYIWPRSLSCPGCATSCALRCATSCAQSLWAGHPSRMGGKGQLSKV
ncbi:hypothetical protein D3C80_1586020 [compost metagenome]